MAAAILSSLVVLLLLPLSPVTPFGTIYMQKSEHYVNGDNRFEVKTGPAQRCYSFDCYDNPTAFIE